MSVAWLRSALICQGETMRPPLDPSSISDADLPDICLRMSVVMASLEQPRCEGRLLPLDIFDAIEALDAAIFHGKGYRIEDWLPLVARFGEYYSLDGTKAIEV